MKKIQAINSPSPHKLNTPLVFTNGEKLYKKLAKTYVAHKKGFFILAPSGSWKTYFIQHQKIKHWLDGDELWQLTGAHPACAWWTMGLDVIHEVDQRSDVITAQAKKLGFWIIGASNFWLKPDAIVIPPWHIQKKYICLREKDHYDGGATSKDYKQVLSHRKEIMQYAKQGVPKFESIDEAAQFLNKKNK